MRITWDNFDKLTREQDLLPISKTTIKGLDVAVAEGSRTGNALMPEDHWIITYAIGMGEFIDMVQSIRIPKYPTSPKTGIQFRSERHERLVLAMDAAKDWIKTNREVGRY